MFRKLKNDLLGKIASKGTIKNISTLMTGTAISSVIPIITAPLMTRIFTTSDYGVLGLYISVTSLLGVVAYSHYSQGIMLSKELTDAKDVLWFSLFFSTLFSLAILILLLFFYFFSSYIRDSEIGRWYFLAPLSLFLNGVSVSLMAWANKVKKYKALASNRVLQAVVTMLVQLGLGVWINNELGLFAGLLVGQAISALLLVRLFYGTKEFGIGAPVYASFRKVADVHKGLLFYNTPTTFINTLINQAPVFLLQKFGGVSYVGSYNFTQRLLGLPQIFLSSAIVEVFKEKASSQFNESGSCRGVFMKTFKALAVIAILPFTFIFILGPSLFGVVFGKEWVEAGVFAQFLSGLFFLRFVVSPLTYVYYIKNKLKEHFALHVLFLLLTVASFYIGDMFLADKRYLILIYSGVYSCIYILYFVRSYQFSMSVNQQ